MSFQIAGRFEPSGKATAAVIRTVSPPGDLAAKLRHECLGIEQVRVGRSFQCDAMTLRSMIPVDNAAEIARAD